MTDGGHNLSSIYYKSNLTFGENSYCINFSFSNIFSLVFDFLQNQFFFWSNVLWKESNSKKVIFEILRMGSHDEKGATLVELWSLRKVKYPSLNLLCLLFQFSLYKNEKTCPYPNGKLKLFIVFWLCLCLRVWWGFHGRSDYLVKTKYSYNYAKNGKLWPIYESALLVLLLPLTS